MAKPTSRIQIIIDKTLDSCCEKENTDCVDHIDKNHRTGDLNNNDTTAANNDDKIDVVVDKIDKNNDLNDSSTSNDLKNTRPTFIIKTNDSPQLNGPNERSSRSKFLVTKLSETDQDSVHNFPGGKIEIESNDVAMPISPDAVPDLNNYRNILSLTGTAKPRPTLAELQNSARTLLINSNRELDLKKYVDDFEKFNEDAKDDVMLSEEGGGSEARVIKKRRTDGVIKFGWIQGVLIRCILNIFGVMIFLRISWLVGQAGTGLISVIIVLATLVTFITSLSMSAICTNGEVRGGGAYYLISRSLGPEFGGAIGIVFSFANAVAAAMYVIGFCETLVNLLESYGISLFGLSSLNQVRILGLATNIVLILIALIGMGWEAKVQIFLLAILLLAFGNFIVGSFIPPTKEKIVKGFTGYSFQNLFNNFGPDFRDGEDFAHLFGVFFPAVTGILAGANISGNLKNPQKAIPKGTLLSILLTSIVYLVFSWMCGATIVRDATGNLNDLQNGSYLNCKDQKCKYGLMNSYQMMEVVSAWAPIITAGIFSASLSSALASLVSAPKVFQAVCQDKIFPLIEFFAKGHGKGNEPWRGYVLTFVISCAFIGVGELNKIAPIISNFFLMSYALVNYSCFDASIARAPGWRPAFKYYNKWVSLFGALLCVSVMFLIEWWAALLTFLAIAALHIYVKQRKPEINWGSSTQAHIYRRSLEYSLKLMNIGEHVKNFRPNFLVLAGPPTQRPALCDFVACLAKNRSLMICGNVLLDEYSDLRPLIISDFYKWLKRRKIKSFYTEVTSTSLRAGVSALMQCTGVGKLKPNTLIIGFKNDWSIEKAESVLEYYEMINDAFLLQYGVCILRLDGGLDYSDLLDDAWNGDNISDSEESDLEEEDADETNKDCMETGYDDGLKSERPASERKKNIEHLISHQNRINLEKQQQQSQVINENNRLISSSNNLSRKKSTLMEEMASNGNMGARKASFLKSTDVIKLKKTKINSGALQGVNLFHRSHHNGYVDVWWLYDDGGLSILLPYLLMQRKYWQKCKLRIFIQTKTGSSDVSEEQRNMATLLSKFRIEFHDLIVFSTTNRKPQAASVSFYEKLIEGWRLKPNESAELFPWKITDIMYKQNIDKINQHLVLRELLNEYSANSSFIFITITVPTRHSSCAPLWLSLLDTISSQMPPMLMVRGNQTSVLTYYS